MVNIFSNHVLVYEDKIHEILVVIADATSGAVKAIDGTWHASIAFLVYQDLSANDIEHNKGRLTWNIGDEEMKQYRAAYPYYFKQNTIYRIKARKQIENRISTDQDASFHPYFFVDEVVEEGVVDHELQMILDAYLKTVTVRDPELGTFNLNRKFSCLEGEIQWLGGIVSVLLEIDEADEATWSTC